MGIAFSMFVALIAVLVWAIMRHAWVMALIAFILIVGSWSDNQKNAGHYDSALAYREAQAAVARATGRPCDYACKEAIADQARRPKSLEVDPPADRL
jgi:hypothetical protein